MKIGIVGSEETKFTEQTKLNAIAIIRTIIHQAWEAATPEAVSSNPNATLADLELYKPTIVSGHCHLGGIDIYAEEQADKILGPGHTLIFPPKIQQWEGGYKQRNIQIAVNSDIVHCITVKTLPKSYTSEFRFPTCYHCKDKEPPHVKSGGCWTMWRCKEHKLWIIE